MNPISSDLKTLAEDILSSYEERIHTVKDIARDTYAQIDHFREQRKEVAEDLKEILAKNQSLRRKDFDQMMLEIISAQQERENEVRAMLSDFRKEEEIISSQLRDLLKKGEEIRVRDFKKMMRKIKEKQENRAKETKETMALRFGQMQEEVRKLLSEFRTEREAAFSFWSQLASATSKKYVQSKK